MIRTVRRRWFDEYYTLTFDDAIWKKNKKERMELFWKEYQSHKWRKKEKYDKYLDKMLYKYDLDIKDYYYLCDLEWPEKAPKDDDKEHLT